METPVVVFGVALAWAASLIAAYLRGKHDALCEHEEEIDALGARITELTKQLSASSDSLDAATDSNQPK